METPKWNSTFLSEKEVYEPAEDTFLLLDALEDDIENLRDKKPLVALEIGSGSGVIITALANLFRSTTHCIAIDISKDACDVTRSTTHLNQANVMKFRLLEALDLREMIDVIVFNPPYVETDDDETSKMGITRSWAGGARGRKILDELLPSLAKAISNSGFFYLVAIDYNDIEDIVERMRGFGFESAILKRRQLRGELLFVLKFKKCSREMRVESGGFRFSCGLF